ncbi:Fic family protein [Fulvivirga imtechensis]|nr:Fic family protein [Fulvivirga imtechensis]
MMDKFDAFDLESLCKAHKVLMKGLVDNPGALRRTSVGIMKGEHLAHIAPPGNMVYPLLMDLFKYLKDNNDLLLIKSCVFHYEFEFIHPFTDGNGRMGRLWQTMILKEYSPVFEFLPVETLIKEHHKNYYHALAQSDKPGNSTIFIEFMLEMINIALEDLLKTPNLNVRSSDRINIFKGIVGTNYFSRRDYLRHNKEISSATASEI